MAGYAILAAGAGTKQGGGLMGYDFRRMELFWKSKRFAAWD